MMVLKYGDKIKIRRSRRLFNLARTGNRYYKILRNKLGWGGEV
jgi:NAD kinase